MNKTLFNFLIKTDGLGSSVVLCRWKRKDPELANKTAAERANIWKERFELAAEKERCRLKTVASQSDVRWIGVDPGRKDVMSCVDEPTPEGEVYSMSFSNARYHTESLFKIRTVCLLVLMSKPDV